MADLDPQPWLCTMHAEYHERWAQQMNGTEFKPRPGFEQSPGMYPPTVRPHGASPVARGRTKATDRTHPVADQTIAERVLAKYVEDYERRVGAKPLYLPIENVADLLAQVEGQKQVPQDCPACKHPVTAHAGRWCRVPTGAVTKDGAKKICTCEAVDAKDVHRG